VQRVVVFPEEAFPAKLTLNPELVMNGDEYFDFCMANPDIWIERNELGELCITPPVGAEACYRATIAGASLSNWAERNGLGKASGCSTLFILPTGAALSPDAAWTSNVRLSQFTREQRRKFLHVAPEFVVEVMSPSDRLSAANEKMQMWIRGGVELAWLIDGDNKTVYIYRAGGGSDARSGISTLAGEGPVAGFELDLPDVWAGL
jgi:Uma2 family endonuclease